MKLTVAFISYNNNSYPYLSHFLPSLKEALRASELKDISVLTLDNSDTNFVKNKKFILDFSQKNKELNLELIKSNINLGFAAAYNVMITKAKERGSEYFLVINPDIILEKDSIKLLIRALEDNKDLAVVAPRLMFWDFKKLKKTNYIDSLGIGLKSAFNFFDICQGEKFIEKRRESYRKNEENMLAPGGAAAMFRMSALREVSEIRHGKMQYFDERFFMYKEDCDLAYRLHLAKMKSRLIIDSVFYHDRSAVAERNIFNFFSARRKKSKMAKIWSFRNQHLIFIKYFNSVNLAVKLKIVRKIIFFFVFSLIFEKFLLKEYKNIINLWRKN